MLKSAHKVLLTNLLLDHQSQVRESLLLARTQLGEGHASVGVLRQRMERAERCMEELQQEPTRAAA